MNVMKPIRKIKSRYYAKQLLLYILLAGVVVISGSSPYFAFAFWNKIFKKGKRSKKDHADLFRYLLGRGMVEWRQEGQDIRIALTEKGRRHAGKYQIDELRLAEPPKKWDGKYRVIVFDIPNTSNFVRNVFRRKLKEFGFHPLQRSVWAYPFPCKEEIEFLREFLGCSKDQIQYLEVIAMENDGRIQRKFNLSMK